MNYYKTIFDGVYIIETKVHEDSRGFFTESYTKKKFEATGLNFDFVQDNHSLSCQSGVLRGLHYQLNPKAQTKLVRCLKGAIFDVIVDIRRDSTTFGKWISVILSEGNKRQVLVPKGYAHGFCTLVPNCEIAYKVDEYYSPEHDRCIVWNDPSICIEWPFSNPVLSDKDSKAPLLKDAEINF